MVGGGELLLTEVGGLGDEGLESESGEGDLGPDGASWWGRHGPKNTLSHQPKQQEVNEKITPRLRRHTQTAESERMCKGN